MAIAGVETAAVVTVGTATIAAFIGAGGYGERIAQGLALNDGTALLAGAIPAAALALLTQALFGLAERWPCGIGGLAALHIRCADRRAARYSSRANTSGSAGFTRKWSKPASSPRCLSWGLPYPVSAM